MCAFVRVCMRVRACVYLGVLQICVCMPCVYMCLPALMPIVHPTPFPPRQLLKRQLLRTIHVREFSEEAAFVSPCIPFVLPAVICE